MALYSYPDNIPGPGPGDVAIAERRLLSDVPGLQYVKAIQQDYLATQDVTFMFTAAQSAIFYLWWRDTLKRGGYWFTANWPLPRDYGTAVRRFIDPPEWNYEKGGSGAWTVTAKTQVRGAGLFPQEPPATPIVFTSLTYGTGTAGVLFTYQTTVTSNNPITSYTATGDDIGAGHDLSIDITSGLVSGVVSSAGIYHLVISATSSDGTVSQPLTLTIAPASTTKLIGMGFNNSWANDGSALLLPLSVTTGDVAPVFSTATPKWGLACYSGNGSQQPVLSTAGSSFNFNQVGEWVVSVWVRPRNLNGQVNAVLSLIGGQNHGDQAGAGGYYGQFLFRLANGDATQTFLDFKYVAAVLNDNGRFYTMYPLQAINNVDTPILPDVRTWIAIVGDATGTRGYINGVQTHDDTQGGIVPVGFAKLYNPNQNTFLNQYWAVGASVSPTTGAFPSAATYSNRFSGQMDDLVAANGPGASVGYKGTSITVPTGPLA